MKTHEYLKQIFIRKQIENRRLSLRSLSLKLKIPSGRLSEFLNGKRSLTEPHIERICKALKVSPDEVIQLKKMFASEDESKKETPYKKVFTEEQLARLTCWKPYALMCLLQTQPYFDFAASQTGESGHAQHISERMKLELAEVDALLQLLAEVHLLQWNGFRWIPTHTAASVGYDSIPNSLIRQSHANTLALAQKKLEQLDVTRRDFSFVTMAINPKDFAKARKMIRTFRRGLTSSLEKGSNQEVYMMAIQFYPVTEADNIGP
ncbi:TIGR02147 family protein [Bdellovibrio bacteriovorus]|uniref:TIGR02147 family protein n=1 Tax=Bdellovibrio bacteriovorus TaxID=959 RepID=UPI0035A728B5